MVRKALLLALFLTTSLAWASTSAVSSQNDAPQCSDGTVQSTPNYTSQALADVKSDGTPCEPQPCNAPPPGQTSGPDDSLPIKNVAVESGFASTTGVCRFNFDKLPYTKPVQPDDDAVVPDCNETDCDSNNCCHAWIFQDVGRFPYPQFGLIGEDLADEGVLIYEGMAFCYSENGHYVVKFNVSKPRMPVVLRMQFRVLLTNGGVASKPFTITLPPIRIPAGKRTKDIEETEHQVSLKGYSPQLAEAITQCGCSQLKFARSGSARFGFGQLEDVEDRRRSAGLLGSW